MLTYAQARVPMDLMRSGGGDPKMAGANERPILRRYIMTMCDGLVPELQRRRLTRTRYATSTSRTTPWNSSGLNLTLGARQGVPLADPKRRQGERYGNRRVRPRLGENPSAAGSWLDRA